MDTARNNEQDFHQKGYRDAWRTLVAGCEVPPSLEVFQYELGERRRVHPGLTADGLARRLSESYQRVTGFFRDAA